MNNILKKIYNKKKEELEYAKQKCTLKSLEKLLKDNKTRNFKKLIEDSKINKNNSIIAEIKKTSPSAGNIIKNYYPDEIAIKYERSGAAAISILTEKNFFEGHIDHLSLINLKTNIPILRKDFIIYPYQIIESKVYNADAILLIASILDDIKIKNFIKIANNIGLDCIIETHTKDEIKRAINIGYPIIGINNRNLDNLNIDTGNSKKLNANIPDEFTIIAESGIKSYSDINEYNKSGIYNFLIGEAILKSKNINEKFKELLNK